jgi:hypothetical protein
MQQPNSQFINEDGSLNYEALGVEPPKHSEHGSDADIRANMQRATPIRWFQRGNELVAETELGELVNFIPTDLFITGIDEAGLPILTKRDM